MQYILYKTKQNTIQIHVIIYFLEDITSYPNKISETAVYYRNAELVVWIYHE